MPKSQPVETGDWFIRRKDRQILRQVTFASDALCVYREYATGEGGYQLESSCSETALKRWGEPITGGEARRLVPNLDERNQSLNQNSRDFAEGIASLSLRVVSNEHLLAEARRRGLIP